MQTENVALTQPTSSGETWEVIVGKDRYLLNEKQMALLKKADQQGMRGIVWFDTFSISIPHIQSTKLLKKKTTHGEHQHIPSAQEQFPNALSGDSMKEKIRHMKQKLLQKKI